MTDDFDEDTLLDLSSNDTIEPIAKARKQEEKKRLDEMLNKYFVSKNKNTKYFQDYFKEKNILIVSRVMFEKSSNEQIEAWFTKFDQVIIDDSENPYKDPLTKKELAKKIGLGIYHNLNSKNLRASINMIQKGTNMISEFGQAFDTGNKQSINFKQKKIKESDYSILTSKPKRNSLKIWSEEKKHQIKPKRRRKTKVKKEYNPFKSENKITFSSTKKVKFF